MPEFLEPYIPLLIGLVALFVAVAFGKILLEILAGRLGSRTPSGFPYRSAETLFSPAERSFLGVLDQILTGTEFRVFGKVRAADVLLPKKGMSRSEWQKAFNRVSAKHFDFVIYRQSDLSFVLLIELDDKSHGKSNRQKRDEFLDGAVKAAGIPLVRVPCQRSYSMEEIAGLIAPLLER
ncbi:MAG: DUF2726 domain-containing protein [Verrucomicrobiales bacterium]|nr:DUF2726 domain-containing protein [Verrucomicrobiales bacterium]